VVAAGMVICLERGTDLHMAQLMPLTPTDSCFSKIQIGFTFLVLADWVVPDKGPLNVCVSLLNCSVCFAEVVCQAALLRELCHPQQSGAQQVKRGTQGPHATTSLQTRRPSQCLMIQVSS